MKYLFSIILLLIFTVVTSQSIDKKHLKTVMVVPFNPNIYNNEATKDMIDFSGMSYDELEFTLRMEFDRSLHNNLADSCKSICLLQSYTTNENTIDVSEIYSYSNYYLSESKVFVPTKNKKFRLSNVASDKSLDTEKDTAKYRSKKQEYDKKNKANNITNGELTSEVKNNNDKFLNVKFKNDEFLQNLSKKFAIDYFLFINEFDIKGDYSDSYAVGKKSFDMSIIVHYSIFNSSSEYIFGGAAIVDYPAYISDPKIVISTYFDKLSSFIIKDIEF